MEDSISGVVAQKGGDRMAEDGLSDLRPNLDTLNNSRKDYPK